MTHVLWTTAILACLVGYGCAQPVKQWGKSGVERSGVDRDHEQCRYEAKAATASYHSTPSKKGESAALGTAIGDGIVIGEKQTELTNACMQAKGYVPG